MIAVTPDGVIRWNGKSATCALGRSGIRMDKLEGDGATPSGTFPLLQVLFRPDRLAAPVSALPITPLVPELGWCDDPNDPDYNRMVALPHPARHERLWRDDGLYDLLIVVGYNHAPVIAGRGSAIFVHVRAPDGGPTQGCVALSLADLTDLVAACTPEETIHILAEGCTLPEPATPAPA